MESETKGQPRTPNDHTAPRTPNGRTAPPTPNDRTAPRTPNGRTEPPTPNDHTAPPTPDGHTAARRAFACPAAAIAPALLTVPALNELFPTVLLPVLTPFLPTQIEAVAGLAGAFRENLPVPADSRGRLFAGLFPSVAAVGSWLVFGGAFRRGGGMQSVGLIPVRVGVAIAGVSSVFYSLTVFLHGPLAGVGVFVRVAATAVLFRLTVGMTRVVRNGECPARTPFRLSAAVLFPGGPLTFALVVADVLSLFGVAGKIPFVLPFSFGVSGVVISPFDGYLAGPAPAAEPFAFAAFLLKFRGRVNSETEHSA